MQDPGEGRRVELSSSISPPSHQELIPRLAAQLRTVVAALRDAGRSRPIPTAVGAALSLALAIATIVTSTDAAVASLLLVLSVVTLLAEGIWGVARARRAAAATSVTRTYDQPSLSALAEGGVTWNGINGIGTYNEWLRFFVHNGAASAQGN